MRNDRKEQMDIVKETNSYIVINKPAGIATQTSGIGQKDVLSEVKNYLSEQNNVKNPYVAVINRLDQPVSGLVLMAKNKAAAADLSRQLSDKAIEKYYKATVYGHMPKMSGELTDYLIKDAKTNSSRIADRIEKQAKEARLEYKVLHRDTDTDELDIHLLTGRHHQIRLQLSNAGCPLLGDRKYGNERSIKYSDSQHIGSVRLTAYRLIFNDPQDGRRVSCTCT